MNAFAETIAKSLTTLRKSKTPVHKGAIETTTVRPPRDWRLGDLVVFQLDETTLEYCISKRSLTSTQIIDFGKVYFSRSGELSYNRDTLLRSETLNLLERHQLSSPRFGLVIPSAKATTRTLRLPKLSASELRNAVYYEGEKKTPFRLDEAYWSYRVCEQRCSESRQECEVSLIAVARAEIDQMRQTFADLGIELDFIYLDVEAIGSALRLLPSFSEKRSFGLINVKAARTDISLYRGSTLKFLHRGAIGSLSLGQSTGPGSESAALFPQMMENFSEALAHEIQNCLDYYGAQSTPDDIETFYIYGDLAYSDELIDRLSDNFGIKFSRFPGNVFERFSGGADISLDSVPSSLPVVSVGVTRYQLSDLTPPTIIENRRRHSFNRRLIGATALSLLVLAGLWWNADQRLQTAETNYQLLENQTQNFENSPAYAGFRIVKQEIARQEGIVSRLTARDSEHYLSLKELSSLTPDGIRLDYFEYYPKSAGQMSRLAGRVTVTTVAPEVALAEYIAKLNGSPLFTDVTLKRHTKEISKGQRILTFTLDFQATS